MLQQLHKINWTRFANETAIFYSLLRYYTTQPVQNTSWPSVTNFFLTPSFPRCLTRYNMGRDFFLNCGGESDSRADISKITLNFLCRPFFPWYRLIRRRHTTAFLIVTRRRLVVVYQRSERAYCSAFTFIPKTETTSSSEAVVTTCQTTRCHIAEDFNSISTAAKIF